MSPQSGHTEPARVRVLLDENIDDGAGANKSRAQKAVGDAANAVRSDGVYERQLVRDVFEKLNVCLLAQLPSTLTVERPTSIEHDAGAAMRSEDDSARDEALCAQHDERQKLARRR